MPYPNRAAAMPSGANENVQAMAASARVVVRTVLIIVTVILCLYLIYLLRRPLGWLAIALFLALAMSGPVNFLDRYMRRGFAILIVYLGLLAVPIGIGALITPPVVTSIEDFAPNEPR